MKASHVVVAAAFAVGLTQTASAVRYSDWSAPAPVLELNTGALEYPNGISRDGLTLYFQRGDQKASGEDLYIAHRPDLDSAWETPVKLPEPINTSANERAAFVSKDGHWLYFASDRPGGAGGSDLYVCWRAHVHDDTAWEQPINLATLNTAGFESGPALFENEEAGTTELYFVSSPTAGGTSATADIYRSTLGQDRVFEPALPVLELNSAKLEGRPYLTRDGLEIYFQSNRDGGHGSLDIWVATRASATDSWSVPQNVAGINTGGQESTPVLSWTGQTMFIGVGPDIFSTTREKVHGKS